MKLLICKKSILSKNHLQIFENVFKKASKAHCYSTRHATKNLVLLPQPQTDHYGKFFVTYQAGSTWNDLQNKLNIIDIYARRK